MLDNRRRHGDRLITIPMLGVEQGESPPRFDLLWAEQNHIFKVIDGLFDEAVLREDGGLRHSLLEVERLCGGRRIGMGLYVDSHIDGLLRPRSKLFVNRGYRIVDRQHKAYGPVVLALVGR